MTPPPGNLEGPGGRNETGPLAGRRIVITRARAQAADLRERLAALGAEVIAAPVIRIEPLPDLTPWHAALAQLDRFDWVVFTSQNTVDVACRDAVPFRGIRVAAIGPATAAALGERGIAVEVVPARHVAEDLVAALAARAGSLAGTRILVPSATRARAALADGLRTLGAHVETIPVYRTVAEEGDGTVLAAELLAGRVAAVTFTSPSTVEHFVGLVGPDAATCGRFTAAVIGPITAATAREHGVAGGGLIEADPATAHGLAAALARFFGGAP
jgi:uroporphyrinogen III methyltransferase/synthase